MRILWKPKCVLIWTVCAASIVLIPTSATGQGEAGAAIMAIEEKPSAGGGKGSATVEGKGTTASATPKFSSSGKKSVSTSTPKTTRTTQRQASTVDSGVDSSGRYIGPVLGDTYNFLNFEIVDKVQPIWTIQAKNAGALGLVQVAVLIGEDGRVLQAKARTGNPLLRPEAERAALASRFNRPTANGRPARALGFLVYRFGTEEEEYEQEQKNKQKRPSV